MEEDAAAAAAAAAAASTELDGVVGYSETGDEEEGVDIAAVVGARSGVGLTPA